MTLLPACLLLLSVVSSADGSVGLSTSSSLCSESKECVEFVVVCRTDEYEVRHYGPTRWVTTDAEAYFMGVGAAMAFRRLFQYIRGANEGGFQMEMAAPVLVRIPEETRMWEPAVYSLGFPLPAAYQEKPPAPTSTKLYFSEMPAMEVYVRSYGGWMLSVTSRLHAHLLTEELRRVGASYNHSYHYGVGYDSPLKLLNRHNEVWYVSEGEPVCTDPQEPTPAHTPRPTVTNSDSQSEPLPHTPSPSEPLPHTPSPSEPLPHTLSPSEPLPHTLSPSEPLPHTPSPSEPLPHTPSPSEPLPHTPSPSEPLPHTLSQSEPLPHTPSPSEPLPHTPSPSEPLPHTPSPSEPLPHTLSPSEPLPHTPSPSEALPHTLSPSEPLPHTPSPSEPLPHTPSPSEPLPHTPSPSEPLPHTPSPSKPLPHTPSPSEPLPHTPSPSKPLPHTPSPSEPLPHTPSPSEPLPHTLSASPSLPPSNLSLYAASTSSSQTPPDSPALPPSDAPPSPSSDLAGAAALSHPPTSAQIPLARTGSAVPAAWSPEPRAGGAPRSGAAPR